MKALVLCAGLGTRLRPMTDFIPKPLVPVVNKPLLGIITEMLSQAGIDGFGFNLHYLPEKIEDYVINNIRYPVRFFPEEKILGTGGSISVFARELNDDFFLVYNGDIFTSGLEFDKLLNFHVDSGADVTMALLKNGPADVVKRSFDGAVIDISNLVGNSSKNYELFTFTGIAVYKTSFARKMPKTGFYSVIDYIAEEMKEERIKINGFDVSGIYWNDIGSPGAYLALHNDILRKRIAFLEGVKVPKNGFYIPRTFKAGHNFKADGFVCFGEDCAAGDNVYVKNSVIMPGTLIEAGSQIDSCILSPTYVIATTL